MRKNYLLFTLLLLSAISTNAQRLKTEDFNYTPGQLTNLNGGANVSGGIWTTLSGATKPLRITAGNLSYPNYYTAPSNSSGHLHLDSSLSDAEDAYTSIQIVKDSTVYVSFLLKVINPDNLIMHDSLSAEYFAALFSSNSNGQAVCRLYIRQGSRAKKTEEADSYNLGIAIKGYSVTPVNWVERDLSPDSVYLITMAYQIIPGASNDVAKLWINQPFAETEPVPDATSAMNAATGTEPINISRFALRQSYNTTLKAGTPPMDIDAIKISAAWIDATLPLQLLSINIINNNGFAKLSWQTCNEINVKHFEIQRSRDAIHFSSIAIVNAKNAVCATPYSYTDTKYLSGTVYYRIKTIDNDGRFSYSPIVTATGKPSSTINILQNPVANDLVLSHQQTGSNAFVQIVAMNGKIIMHQKIPVAAIQTGIDVSALTKGNYIIVFINDKEKQSLKFIKH